MKKWILALLVMAMALFGSSLTVFAYTEGYFSYEVEDQSVTITDYFGDATEVTIPASIAGNPVNTIAAGAFTDSNVEKINLPDTIMTIENGALGTGIQVVYNSNLSEEEQEKYAPSDDTDQESGGANDSTNEENVNDGNVDETGHTDAFDDEAGSDTSNRNDSDTQDTLAGTIDENTVQMEADEDAESQADTDVISPEEEPSEEMDSLEEVQADAEESHNSVFVILIVVASCLVIVCVGLTLWMKKRRTP